MGKTTTQRTKNTRWILYSVAVACFLLINGVFLYKVVTVSGSTLLLVAITLILWFGITVFFLVWRKQKNRTNRIFMIILVVLGVMYSAVFPPATVPDEFYHFESSYKYSDYLMLKDPQADALPMRADDKTMLDASQKDLTYQSYTTVKDNLSLLSTDSTEVTVTPLNAFGFDTNPPQLKIPSALGITLARLLDLGSYPLFYLGRLFNFLFFALLAFFAVKITPVAKKAFMAISLLPMTLHITSSFSYDAGILGLSFLLIALCLKAIYSKERVATRVFVGIAVVTFLLAPCKVIYALLAFMVLLIPLKAFSSKPRAILFKTGVPLLSIGTVLLFRLATMSSLASMGSTAADALGSRGGDQGQLHSIFEFFSDPMGTITLFIKTLDQFGDFYFSTTIGGSLGWFQPGLVAPWFIVLAFALILLLSFLRSPKDDYEVPFKHKLLYVILSCGMFFGVMLSMFLGWTFQSDFYIMGVQGRYFLPFLPLIALVIYNRTIVVKKDLSSLILFAMLAFNLAYLVRLFAYSTIG